MARWRPGALDDGVPGVHSTPPMRSGAASVEGRRDRGIGGELEPDFLSEPGLSDDPVALHGLERDAEDGGGFLEGEPGEVALFDDGCGARIGSGEAIEGVIESEELAGGLVAEEGSDVVDRNEIRVRAALLALSRACIVDEDAAHGLGGDGEEMAAVLGVEFFTFGETQIGFVYECGRTERVTGPFVSELSVSEDAEFVVDEGQESWQRLRIIVAEAVEPGRQRSNGRCLIECQHVTVAARRGRGNGHLRVINERRAPSWYPGGECT